MEAIRALQEANEVIEESKSESKKKPRPSRSGYEQKSELSKSSFKIV